MDINDYDLYMDVHHAALRNAHALHISVASAVIDFILWRRLCTSAFPFCIRVLHVLLLSLLLTCIDGSLFLYLYFLVFSSFSFLFSVMSHFFHFSYSLHFFTFRSFLNSFYVSLCIWPSSLLHIFFLNSAFLCLFLPFRITFSIYALPRWWCVSLVQEKPSWPGSSSSRQSQGNDYHPPLTCPMVSFIKGSKQWEQRGIRNVANFHNRSLTMTV